MIDSTRQSNNKDSRQFKVLHVVTRSHPFGGAQIVVWFSVSNSTNMFPPSLACGYGDELREKCEEKNIPYFALKDFSNSYLDPIGDIKTIYQLYKLIKKEKFDIVHLNSSKAGFAGRIAARLAGVPVVIFTIHGLSFDFQIRPKIAPFLLLLEKFFSKWTDGFISVADSCRDDFLKYRITAPEKIKVIHHAIDYAPIDNAQKNPKIFSEFSFPENSFVVGSVGNIMPAKAFEYFVEAAEIVLKDAPDIKFIIAGDGPDREKIQSVIKEKNLESSFKLLGIRDDVPDILKSINVYVRSSIQEGLGLALIEAMYAGLPCVVTDTSGSREIIDNEKNGFIVPVKDPQAIASKILYLYNNPDKAAEIANAAYERVKDDFSISTMENKIEEYYKELLKKKGLLK